MLSYLFGKKDNSKPENADPELAMRDALDAHGDFKTKIDGTLEFDDFLVLRATIMRQASRQFNPKKDALNEKKLEAFKNEDQQTYVRTFREGQAIFNQCILSMTQKACEWIELDIKNYQLSVQAVMENEEQRTKMQTTDAEVRLQLEEREIKETEETIVEASKFKFQRDMEMFRKLQALKYTTSPQAQQEIQNVELSKTSDALLVKFGFDLSHLARCSKHFDLDNNKEMASFRKIVIAQKESEEKAEFARAQPPKEVVDAIIKEGDALGKPQFKQDGTMTFDYFLDSMKIVVRYTHQQTKDGLLEHQAERRAAIKDGNDDLYQKLILKCANWEQLTSTLIQANLYQHLKVPKPVFEKSMQTYLMDPSKRTLYEEEIQKLRDSLRERKIQDLTREQVLDSVKHLEEAKLKAQMKMYDIVRAQRVAPQMINAIIKVEKLRADDIFFNETGIEEEDVEPNIKRLDMENDEAYKAIIDEYAEKSKAFLEGKKDETAAMMAKAQAIAQQRQEAMKAQQTVKKDEQ